MLFMKKPSRMVKLIFDADFKSSLRISFFRWKSWENSFLSLKNWQNHPKFKDEFFSRGRLRWKKLLRADSWSSGPEVYRDFFRFLLPWRPLSSVRSSICENGTFFFTFCLFWPWIFTFRLVAVSQKLIFMLKTKILLGSRIQGQIWILSIFVELRIEF